MTGSSKHCIVKHGGHAMSPLLFYIELIPLSALLAKSAYVYRLNGGTTISHLLYMDSIKIYAKNEQHINSLIHLTRVFNSDIGMTLDLAKCGRKKSAKKSKA